MALRGRLVEIDVDAAALVDEQRPQIVDAVRVVGMFMRDQHAVEPVDLGVEQLLAQVRRAVDQHARAWPAGRSSRSTSSEQRRRRFFGLFGSQAPQPSATRGTPIDEPQPRMVKVRLMRRPPRLRGTLLNSRKKFSVVCRAISSAETPRVSRQHFGGLDDEGRLVALAAIRQRREIRRIGFDQDAVGRQSSRRCRAVRPNS